MDTRDEEKRREVGKGREVEKKKKQQRKGVGMAAGHP